MEQKKEDWEDRYGRSKQLGIKAVAIRQWPKNVTKKQAGRLCGTSTNLSWMLLMTLQISQIDHIEIPSLTNRHLWIYCGKCPVLTISYNSKHLLWRLVWLLYSLTAVHGCMKYILVYLHIKDGKVAVDGCCLSFFHEKQCLTMSHPQTQCQLAYYLRDLQQQTPGSTLPALREAISLKNVCIGKHPALVVQ